MAMAEIDFTEQILVLEDDEIPTGGFVFDSDESVFRFIQNYYGVDESRTSDDIADGEPNRFSFALVEGRPPYTPDTLKLTLTPKSGEQHKREFIIKAYRIVNNENVIAAAQIAQQIKQ